MKNNVLEEYRLRFGQPHFFVKSPGRANIIGEHTDYNHGLVLPFAIEQGIYMALGPNNLGKIRLVALDIDEYAVIDVSKIKFLHDGWIRYFINALAALDYQENKGIDLVFGGDLPQGGGVSSSSALTCGFIYGVNALLNLDLDIDQMIDLASQAENGIGLNGGTMDQTAIFKGVKGKAMKIDFLQNTTTYYDTPCDAYSFYLFNSGQKHNLVDTEYNKRRATCESALAKISERFAKVKTLRDVTIEMLESAELLPTEIKRCTHVIEENSRVEALCKVLADKNYNAIGNILTQTHHSLSTNYEVSTHEIDYLVQRSLQINTVLGSRIMGGGFGGCTINFIKDIIDDSDIQKLKDDYLSKTGLTLVIHRVDACDGVRLVDY